MGMVGHLEDSELKFILVCKRILGVDIGSTLSRSSESVSDLFFSELFSEVLSDSESFESVVFPLSLVTFKLLLLLLFLTVLGERDEL